MKNLGRLFPNNPVSGWNSGSVASNAKGDIVPKTGTFSTTTPTGYKVVSFTASGTLQVTGSGATVDILVVGGGGAGGNHYQSSGAGGGGAGALIYVTNVTIPAGTYPVTVGSGGAVASIGDWYNPANTDGLNGNPSLFYNYIAVGGGGGAAVSKRGSTGSALNGHSGSQGGCGGGSSGYNTSQYHPPADASGPAGLGYPGGGNGPHTGGSYGINGGGGGGQGAQGGAGGSSNAGSGGSGVSNSITGSAVIYAAGGGGGGNSSGAGGGSSNTGGSGAGSGYAAGSPVANTGSGGGGGGGNTNGGTPTPGASGIVIVRIATT